MVLRWIAIVFWLFSAPLSLAQTELKQFIEYRKDQQWLFDAQIEFQLADTVVEAIEHEIPILFVTEVELRRRDQFILFPYQHRLIGISYTTELRYSRFYKRYTLHNHRNGNQQHFATLEAALRTLGTLHRFHLTEENQLYPGLTYHLAVRIKLNYWQLPAPILTHAIFDQHWRFSTPWYELPIQAGRRK